MTMTEQDHVCADGCGHERTGRYVYTGDPLDSRSMDLTVRYPDDVRTVPAIDSDGLWVTVIDEEGMECEVKIKGLAWGLIESAMADSELRGLMPPRHVCGKPVGLSRMLSRMLSAYLALPRHVRPGAETLLFSAVEAVHGLTGAAADEWLAEELQERLAARG